MPTIVPPPHCDLKQPCLPVNRYVTEPSETTRWRGKKGTQESLCIISRTTCSFPSTCSPAIAFWFCNLSEELHGFPNHSAPPQKGQKGTNGGRRPIATVWEHRPTCEPSPFSSLALCLIIFLESRKPDISETSQANLS